MSADCGSAMRGLLPLRAGLSAIRIPPIAFLLLRGSGYRRLYQPQSSYLLLHRRRTGFFIFNQSRVRPETYLQARLRGHCVEPARIAL
jgi:hypothetical protein